MSDQAPPPPVVGETTAEPKGFGGWLILPVIGVCVGPVRTLVEMITSMKDYDLASKAPNGNLVIAFEAVVNIAFLTLQIVVLVAMLGRRSSFPKLFTWLWLAALLLPPIDLVVVSTAFHVSPVKLIDGDFGRTMGGAIVMGLWAWYMHVSVRVRNTFTN